MNNGLLLIYKLIKEANSMKKLEYKVLPCIFCTIGLNCYVAGHNLVKASINKLTNHKKKEYVSNNEQPIVSKNNDGKTTK